MQIITVQHTQAEHHLNGMVGGSSDWPLTALGHERDCAGAGQANSCAEEIQWDFIL